MRVLVLRLGVPALLALTLILPASVRVANSQAAVGAGYWHAVGAQLVDASGRPVRIAGVTWYGMETANWVPAGLDIQPYSVIMNQVRLLGYNVIRLPLSNELIERNPIVTRAVRANPELKGLHALEVLDRIVAYARAIGLKILLDDHRSHAARPKEINTLDEPLWYTAAFPESAWINDWKTLALRYRGNSTVIGFDLRNEPHTAGPGPWNLHAYLHQGATWGPWAGVDDPATDWRAAAERAGNAILAVNPDLLIVVEGINLYPDAQSSGGMATSWWSGLLLPAERYPVTLDVPGRLVYSVHDYGPRKAAMPWFSRLTYRALDSAYRHNWAFVPGETAAPAVPLLLGEFGTCNSDPTCVTQRRTNNQATWFRYLLLWLRRHPQVGWSFYALNGTNANRCATDNGLLNAEWNGVSSAPLQASLVRDQPSRGLAPATDGPIFPRSTPAQAPRSTASPLCQLP